MRQSVCHDDRQTDYHVISSHSLQLKTERLHFSSII